MCIHLYLCATCVSASEFVFLLLPEQPEFSAKAYDGLVQKRESACWGVTMDASVPRCSPWSLVSAMAVMVIWSALQVNVKAKSAFNNKLFALNVVISIPVPDNTAKADIQTTQGM